MNNTNDIDEVWGDIKLTLKGWRYDVSKAVIETVGHHELEGELDEVCSVVENLFNKVNTIHNKVGEIVAEKNA